MKRIFFIGVLVALTACAEGEIIDATPDQFAQAVRPAPLAESRTKDRLDRYAPRPGFTYATASKAHGVQVEYFAPDGRAFLWYPGNRSAVSGRYRYKVFFGPEKSSIYDIEFLYPRRSHNPATGRSGGSWEFTVGAVYQQGIVAYARGDLFNLSSGRVPSVRSACRLPPPMRPMGPSPIALC